MPKARVVKVTTPKPARAAPLPLPAALPAPPAPPDTWRGIPLTRPCAIDLYCGGGGAGRGLLDAGFATVVGVDREVHRTSYEHAPGMRFLQLDVKELTPDDLKVFDFVWASPPCQAYTGIIPKSQREKHEARWKAAGRHIDMIPWTREVLRASGRPYIIENVQGAPLENPVRLCGTMEGMNLGVFRHRLFESNLTLHGPGPCRHANCSTGALTHCVRLPKTEKYTRVDVDADRLPEGVERVEVAYPCRNGERPDYIYRATNDEMRKLFRETYGRNYARSVRDLCRAIGALVPMSSAEKDAEKERHASERKGALAPGQKQMFPVYGAATKSRGTTEEWREALGCTWMTRDELCQAIPPAYSKYLGTQVLKQIEPPRATNATCS